MAFTVKSTDLSNIDFERGDTVKEVLQNIAVILSTPKGTVPYYRDFGLDMSFLDMPANFAAVRMRGAAREAIEQWEPRATVVSIRTVPDPAIPGRFTPEVEVEIRDG